MKRAMTMILDLVGSNVNDADENYNGPTSMSTTTNKTAMQSEQYIPYSVRNNITDIEIGKLLDYLEREIGYDLIIIDNGFSVLIANEKDCLKFRTTKDPITSDGFSGFVEISGPAYMKIPYKLFYLTYKTLIPALRNIYLK